MEEMLLVLCIIRQNNPESLVATQNDRSWRAAADNLALKLSVSLSPSLSLPPEFARLRLKIGEKFGKRIRGRAT